MRRRWIIAGLVAWTAGGLLLLPMCGNNPYRPGESASRTVFMYLIANPVKMDPANAYYIHEGEVIDKIYEPPFDYHYLKRPYELIPLTTERVPEAVCFDRDGRRLEGDPPVADVARVEYTIRVRPGIFYQPHPCFATNAQGAPLYNRLTDEDVEEIESPNDFPVLATRELTAEDYVRGFRRLADSRLSCPILATLERYVLGVDGLSKAISEAVVAERARRREAAGAGYRQEDDERDRPLVVDYLALPCEGVQALDRYTFRIVLKRKYPQILYWMAMHFFAPIPQEVLDFYGQGVLAAKKITLNVWPVGTGAHYMLDSEPNRRLILARNPNYHDDHYPSEGEPGDRGEGRLDDAGARLPLVDRIVMVVEKEPIPSWIKFVQGYYDYSTVTAETFDRTVNISVSGTPNLSDEMEKAGYRMFVEISMANHWLGFNMLDETIGGYTPEKAALRNAVSLALDWQEYLDVFMNGRGALAGGPVPPDMFGHRPGEAGVNPYIDRWDAARGRAVRQPIEKARELMVKAGYPDGRRPDGHPLRIYLDHSMGGEPTFVGRFEWMRRRLSLIGIDLQERGTELKRFNEKLDSGNFQMYFSGWYCDYPDPENFLFLLYGPNSRTKSSGENKCNYANPEFDRLFEQMESMNNGPERQAIIDKMVDIARRDAPLSFGYHPVTYTLSQGWLRNMKPHQMTKNIARYWRVDTEKRTRLLAEWNRPRLVPVLVVWFGLAALVVPLVWRRSETHAAGAGPGGRASP